MKTKFYDTIVFDVGDGDNDEGMNLRQNERCVMMKYHGCPENLVRIISYHLRIIGATDEMLYIDVDFEDKRVKRAAFPPEFNAAPAVVNALKSFKAAEDIFKDDDPNPVFINFNDDRDLVDTDKYKYKFPFYFCYYDSLEIGTECGFGKKNIQDFINIVDYHNSNCLDISYNNSNGAHIFLNVELDDIDYCAKLITDYLIHIDGLNEKYINACVTLMWSDTDLMFFSDGRCPTQNQLNEEIRRSVERDIKYAKGIVDDDCIAKMIVIPDLHGQTFWKKAVERFPETEIVFLGDYLDSYSCDQIRRLNLGGDVERMNINEVSSEKALENLKEIIEYARTHSHCHLLLGEHDMHYITDTSKIRKPWYNSQILRDMFFDRGIRRTIVCGANRDEKNAAEIHRLFVDNIDLFSLAYMCKINGKSYLFSHAPILKGWAESVGYFNDAKEVVEKLNNLLKSVGENGDEINRVLEQVSSYRGGYDECGSPIWADIAEINENGDNLIAGVGKHIFGHNRFDWELVPSVSNDKFVSLDFGISFLITSYDTIIEVPFTNEDNA
ncbi:MAG: hypothetical protein K2K76_04080 [Muribaculaceae bacterium]|nr:hypothetical protein [Muribaculaceae bacterium]